MGSRRKISMIMYCTLSNLHCIWYKGIPSATTCSTLAGSVDLRVQKSVCLNREPDIAGCWLLEFPILEMGLWVNCGIGGESESGGDI